MQGIKWIVVPAIVGYLGFAIVGPNLGGKIVQGASKQINLPPEIKEKVASALKPKRPTIEDIIGDPEDKDSERNEPIKPSKSAPNTSDRAPEAGKSESGPLVEVQVREAAVISNTRSTPNQSGTATTRRRTRKPRPRKSTSPKVEVTLPAAPTPIADPAGAPENLGGTSADG
jgi:hypothetical protein